MSPEPQTDAEVLAGALVRRALVVAVVVGRLGGWL
jgi:hypothetical protein